jgi:hypothetical protein
MPMGANKFRSLGLVPLEPELPMCERCTELDKKIKMPDETRLYQIEKSEHCPPIDRGKLSVDYRMRVAIWISVDPGTHLGGVLGK